MPDRDQRLIDMHLDALALLGWHPPPAGDAVDQVEAGELLDADEAGFVAGRDSSTIGRWAQATKDEGKPIGFRAGSAKAAGPWEIVTRRLLDYVQRKFGNHARREAETRLRKLLETRARSQQSAWNASARASASPEACDIVDNNAAVSR